MNRRQLARLVAPTAPPCFSSRDQWVGYLEQRAVLQRGANHPGPLILKEGQLPAFNYSMAFCGDCTKAHKSLSTRAGRCQPKFLVELKREEDRQMAEALKREAALT